MFRTTSPDTASERGGLKIFSKNQSLTSILRVNALFYISLFVLLMGIAALSIYRHQREKVEERMLRASKEVELTLENEFRFVEHNLKSLRQTTSIFDQFPRNSKSRRLFRELGSEILSDHRIQFDAYLALEPELARKYLNQGAAVIGIQRQARLEENPAYLKPESFQDMDFTSPNYLTDRSEVWYHIAKRSRHVEYSEIYFDTTYTKQWMISAALGIYSDQGKFLGAAGTDILLYELSRAVESASLGSTGGVLIVDSRSNRILNKPLGRAAEFLQIKERYGRPDMSGDRLSNWYALLRNQGKVQPFTGDNGKRYVVSALTVDSLPWVVVSFQEYSEIYSSVLWQISLLLTLGLGGLGVLILLSQKFQQSVTLPLQRLIQSVKENIRSVEKSETMRVEVSATGYYEVKTLSELVTDLVRVVNEHMHHQMQEIEKERAKSIHSARMASVGQLAGNVAHEINNPLAALSLNAEVLESDLIEHKFSPDVGLERVKSIRRLTDRMAQTVKGFLSLSREGSAIPKRRTSLQEIVQDTLNVSQARIRSSGIELKIAPMPPLYFYCRGVQISQVLLNLVINSYDAVMGLPEKWIHIEFSENEKFGIIKVIDSGHGIPGDIVAHMMEPFFTTKDVNRGTGLGLSISKSIIEEHGGRLYYDLASEHTCFTVELPKI